MKFFKSPLNILAVLLLPLVGFKVSTVFGWMGGAIAMFVLANLFFGSWLKPTCMLGTPTLITNILTGKIIAPLRTKVPELGFFSVDWGRSGGEFAPAVKFGQSVTSHMIAAPTAEAFTPGSGLGSNTQNPKDLLTDVSVAIDQAAKVSIKLPVSDAIRYILDPAFQETLNQATISLGRYVLGQAVAHFTKAAFSQEKVATIAAVELETIGDVRGQMNKLGTLTPRFILGETDFVKALSRDPVIQSGDYHGQLTGEDPYITLVNVEGFSQIREYPNMPTNTVVIGDFTTTFGTDVVNLVAHGLANGTRVRVTTSAADLPAPLAIDTDYWVRDAAADTFKLAATPGGAAIDIADNGTGTHTIKKFEALNALAFERRAVHIAFRDLLDNSALARMLGIPETSKKIKAVDAETGATVTWHFWEDATGTSPTGDVYATAVMAFGIRAGRELQDATAPAALAAGTGMDYGAVRLVESAAVAA